MSNATTHEFQAETKKLLDIVINSLYTERDVFIRELISNAADALEKYRHESLTRDQEELFDSHVPLEISIDLDEENNELTITDTGIGMTGDELIADLGTIAHSGSNSFLAELAEAARKDVSLIGQFGVGFYSAFMAGAKVRVQSRSWDGSEGNEWISDGRRMVPVRLRSASVRVCIEVPESSSHSKKGVRIMPRSGKWNRSSNSIPPSYPFR